MFQNGEVGDEKEKDIYDVMLTQAEIQEGVNDVNVTVKKEEAEIKCEYDNMYQG